MRRRRGNESKKEEIRARRICGQLGREVSKVGGEVLKAPVKLFLE